MLRKLLKYDFSSVWRVALTVTVAALVASLTLGASAALHEMMLGKTDNLSKIIYTTSAVVIVISALTIFIALFTISIFVFVRFYKNLFTDEGYLTFTLPASREAILASKTINAMLWFIYESILIIVCVFIGLTAYYAISGPTEPIPPPTEEIVYGDVYWGIGYFILAVVIILVAEYLSVTIIQLCITVASVTFKRARLIAGIGIYYLINTVLQLAAQLFITVPLLIFGDDIGALFNGLLKAGININVIIYCIMAFTAAVLFIIASIAYRITRKTITRKLNLP